ncbi:dentin sialophosphoprotein-like isoform X1 [Trichogramma pretiosum]|uniref:dentin sialophosphoprotein-like isoform X1 n=1 Tax=Trichogramma pretiosum TaxID=7493 RepID=UPI0006C94216|nr:dentin sialophosphoprotein-like isoform X1 [Trichogramma pretiosum]
MAPGPELQRPDSSSESSNNKASNNGGSGDSTNNSCSNDTEKASLAQQLSGGANPRQVFILPKITAEADVCAVVESSQQDNELPTLNNTALVDNKQEEPATLSTLNEGELRALLDEAITYKCPKDREGKSSLFKELLQEAEADEPQEGHWILRNNLGGSVRSGASSVRSHRRQRRGDSYYSSTSSTSSSCAERITHGGSLQNLAREVDADSLGAYLNAPGQLAGGAKRKQKRHSGPSVSARQREGGSLPSNVDASHTLTNLVNFDSLFEKKKGLSEEKSLYDWTNKEKSKSLDKTSYSKKEEKEKDKKDSKLSGSCDIESELCDNRSSNSGKLGANEMLDSVNSPPDNTKQDKDNDKEKDKVARCPVLTLDDYETRYSSAERNASNAYGLPKHALEIHDDEGTEMKLIEGRNLTTKYITRATFDVPQPPIDPLDFQAFREHTAKLEKSKVNVNGLEGSGSSIPFSSYNSAKKSCVMTGNGSVYSMMNWAQPNISMVSRFTAQHIAGKDTIVEKKPLDENGNSVLGVDRKKRKPKVEQNVVVYKAADVKGHRDDNDIDSLVNFIENKDTKSKKGKQPSNNTVKIKTSTGTKSRSRDNKDAKREEVPAKLQKTISLEEISKTKLEDLTTDNPISSEASNAASQHDPVAIRRNKQRSTGDTTAVDSRGDRRSWGTEEGQSIYCNDTGDDYSNNSRRNSVKKVSVEPEAETEFHVVTNKKKKTKKQRRSSSGGRAQNLGGSGSYLQRNRVFPNDYRRQLSPDRRRKSASSMPPSDKSDCSDGDSVHSLPIPSKKTASSSSDTPQASYADIAKMASLTSSANQPPNISAMHSNTWPAVTSSKSSADIEKISQNDDYPSLDEVQQNERKARQHQFAQQLMTAGIEKLPSSKVTDQLKTAASIKKVTKYVQDIEKMQLQEQQAKKQQQPQLSNNSSPISSEATLSNLSSASCSSDNSTVIGSDFSNVDSSDSNAKDSIVNSYKANNCSRMRKSNNGPDLREYARDDSRDSKKPSTHAALGDESKTFVSGVHSDDKDVKKVTGITMTGSSDNTDVTKSRIASSSKSHQQFRPPVDSEIIRVNKIDRLPKGSKEQSPFSSKDSNKTSYPQVQMSRPEKIIVDSDVKKFKPPSYSSDSDKEHKSLESRVPSQTSSVKSNSASSSSRLQVILDIGKNSNQERIDPPETSELTFGFEINEQLLHSDEVQEAQTIVSADYRNPSTHFRQPQASVPQPGYNEHSINARFPMQHFVQLHPMAAPQLMVPAMTYMGPQMRVPGQYVLSQHPPPLQGAPAIPPESVTLPLPVQLQVAVPVAVPAPLPASAPAPVSAPVPTPVSTPTSSPDSAALAPVPVPPVFDEVNSCIDDRKMRQHDLLVEYVGTAWNEILRETENSSSVYYYSGQ